MGIRRSLLIASTALVLPLAAQASPLSIENVQSTVAHQSPAPHGGFFHLADGVRGWWDGEEGDEEGGEASDEEGGESSDDEGGESNDGEWGEASDDEGGESGGRDRDHSWSDDNERGDGNWWNESGNSGTHNWWNESGESGESGDHGQKKNQHGDNRWDEKGGRGND
jgi:hypothetical protein